MQRWSEDEVDYLIGFNYDNEGEKIKDVAKFLNRTEFSVKSKLMRLREASGNEHMPLLEERWTEKEREMLKHMKIQNRMNYKEIGEKLGRTEASVNGMIQRMGLSRKITSTSELKRKEETIRKMAKEGYTRKEIAEEVELAYSVIKNFINSRGIKCINAPRTKTYEQKKQHNRFMRRATGGYR